MCADTFGTSQKCPDYIERCPHFRGELIHEPNALGLYKHVLNNGVFAFHGVHYLKFHTPRNSSELFVKEKTSVAMCL